MKLSKRRKTWVWGLILSLGWITAIEAAAGQPTSTPVIDAGCAKCHEEIYKRYIATPMANASGVATARSYPSNPVRTRSSATYEVKSDPGGSGIKLRMTSASGESKLTPLGYFLGSGHLGTTYTYELNGFWFESPVAWYAAARSFDMKPGLASLQHTVPALPLQSGCIRCHMSDVQRSDPGTLNHYKEAAFLHTGVTCESCHGDTATHAVKGEASHLVKLAKLSALKRDSICINCHLEGDALVERAGRSALEFKPGQSITDLVAYYVYAGKDTTVRAVSEVEQLAQSRCKLSSGEKMSCTSCHDPHYTPSVAEKVAYFRGKCLACHSDPGFAESHHPEQGDCTSCHMKSNGAENIPHVAWTDHRILKLPGVHHVESSRKDERLVAVFPGSGSRRDLGLAYYKAMLAGDRALEPAAWNELTAVRNEICGDVEGLNALGVMSAARGDEGNAEYLFTRVLAIDGDNLTALSNLGTLMAKTGRLSEAQRLLNRAFARNEDLPGLALNVARVDCTAGNSDAAEKALEAALMYNPGLESLESLKIQVAHCPAASAQ